MKLMKRCCEEDYGGSHYHCANCGKVSGMYGHTINGEFTCERDPSSPFCWTEEADEVQRVRSGEVRGASGPEEG